MYCVGLMTTLPSEGCERRRVCASVCMCHMYELVCMIDVYDVLNGSVVQVLVWSLAFMMIGQLTDSCDAPIILSQANSRGFSSPDRCDRLVLYSKSWFILNLHTVDQLPLSCRTSASQTTSRKVQIDRFDGLIFSLCSTS